jgi:putative ABC transport system substrate-binding protein
MRFDRLKRRDFIRLLGAAAAWPLAVHAQESKRVGVLMNAVETDATSQAFVAAFVQQLKRLGWIDGQNLHVDYRWNAGDAKMARTYAAELVKLAPDAILSASTTNLAALQRLSPTMPIVFLQVSEPVTQGFVLNLARPGGNITGFSAYEFTIGSKWVDLLKQLVPTITRVAVMFNPQTSPQSKFFLSSVESAASPLKVEVNAIHVQSSADIELAIENVSHQPNSGLIFPPDAFTIVHREQIVALAARHRVPVIYSQTVFVQSGGLMSYGPQFEEQFRQAAVHVDRILKGTKPGELPVQSPTKFTLAINLKTAKALGFEIPVGLLLIADEQIE